MLKASTVGTFSLHSDGMERVNSATAKIRRTGGRPWLLILIMASGLSAAANAQQFYPVDCSGANPGAYPTIKSALAAAGSALQTVVPSVSFVTVTGPCNENVNINNATNIDLGAVYGTTVTLNGSINVSGSNSIFLYGLNVTNPAGNAFTIAGSHGVILQNCSGNGSLGLGLSATNLSDVSVDGPGSFDNNGAGGIQLNNNAALSIVNWAGPFDISNNHGPGVWLSSGALFSPIGLTTIENNVNHPGSAQVDGFGIVSLGGTKVQIGTCFGPNVIQGNQAGGIETEEDSELSLWNCGKPYQSFITANGPVGISAGLGSQVTLYEDVQISGHTGSGVDLYGKSQLNIYGPNLISQNGTAGDPRSAGIVVDGNSEAYLRGGTISGNHGPGILALVNSSADFTGATFTGNTDGVIACDSSSVMVSDLSMRNPGKGVECRTPHNLGNRHGEAGRPMIADFTAQKLKAAQYKAMASPKALPLPKP